MFTVPGAPVCANPSRVRYFGQAEQAAERILAAFQADNLPAALAPIVKRGGPGAKKDAQRLFGRNAIVRELGVKSGAMVTKSPEWQAIAAELNLPRLSGRGSTGKPARVGSEIALEEQAIAASVPAADQLVRRETIQLIEAAMPADVAEPTIEKLLRGEITDDRARQLIEVYADQARDDRTRRTRQDI
jgi:hypothetical protein